jgi:creatinine amidohydrolase/Fe(II)-dependent formamide hydrolase-like protein
MTHKKITLKKISLFAFISLMQLTSISSQEKILEFMDLDFKAIEDLGNSGAAIIVPMVQIESHGVHLPVGTDYYCAMEIAKLTAKKCNAIVGIPITFGNCVPYSSWPGYIIIDTQTLSLLVKQYLMSIQEQGFKKIAFIIMHGGDNFYGIKLAVDEYIRENPDISVAITYVGMLLGKKSYKLLGKGIDIDTSIMLYLKPELVCLEKLDAAQKNRLQPNTTGQAIRYEKDKNLAYYRPDNFKDASNSTAKLGEKFLEILSDNLAEIINDLNTKFSL